LIESNILIKKVRKNLSKENFVHQSVKTRWKQVRPYQTVANDAGPHVDREFVLVVILGRPMGVIFAPNVAIVTVEKSIPAKT